METNDWDPFRTDREVHQIKLQLYRRLLSCTYALVGKIVPAYAVNGLDAGQQEEGGVSRQS